MRYEEKTPTKSNPVSAEMDVYSKTGYISGTTAVNHKWPSLTLFDQRAQILKSTHTLKHIYVASYSQKMEDMFS